MKHQSVTRPRVFLVDDDLQVLNSMASLVASAGFRPEPIANPGNLTLSTSALQSSVFVLDLAMPTESGQALVDRLQQQDPGFVYLVHSATATVGSAVNLMERSALTVIEKPASPELLISWIERAAARVEQRIQAIQRMQQINQAFERLSERERQVALHCALGVDNVQVADRLNLSVRTVEGHRLAINQKVSRDGAKQLYSLLATHAVQDAALNLPRLVGIEDGYVARAVTRLTPTSVL